MVRRRPCASRFARARLVAVPAALGQAAPGGVVARLVAAPAVLGPVVPDAVPRSDSSPCPCGSSGRRRCARPRRSHGRGGEPVPAALLVRTAAPGRGLRPGRGIVGETRVGAGAVEGGLRPGRGIIGVGAAGPVGLGLWTPPGSRDYHSTREGGRRDRRAAREDVCQGHDLAGRPAISRTRPGRDGTGTGPGPTTTPGPTPGWRGPGPGRPRPGPACVNCRSAQRDPGAGAGADPGPACAMRAQRDTVHPGSRRASPARRNPPALDPREPTSHNASPGDITRTTPPGGGDAQGRRLRSWRDPETPPGGGDAQAKTRRAVAPTPAPARHRSHRSRRRVAPGTARPPPRRRSAGAPAAPPDRSPEEP